MDRARAGRRVLTEDMHPGQLRVDEAAVTERVATAFPALAGLPVTPLRTPGTVNALFRIGTAHVARLPLQPTARPEIEAEAAAFDEFASVAPIAAPAVLGVADGDERYPSAWSVQTWVPGRTASEALSAEAPVPALVDDVAGLIGALRAAGLHGRTFDGRGRGGDLRAHDEWMTQCFEKSGHLLDAKAAHTLWVRLSELPGPGIEVMSHRDLIPPNLVVTDDRRLAGVLDGGSFGPADRSLDLVVAWHLFELDDRRRLRAVLDCDDVEWRRGAAWALEQAMGLGWYYERSNPVMAELGLRTMRRLMTDPDL